MGRYLIDGTNVMGSRPTGWWRDRPRAMRGLVRDLERFVQDSGDEIAVIFDGSPFDLSSESVDVAFASRRGRDAADDDIAARAEPGMTVVTSDGGLSRRVREAGADVMGAGEFLRATSALRGAP